MVAAPVVVGRVAELWRYPVKSVGGHRVERVELVHRGVRDDRLWAVRDVAADLTASARRVPALLGCTARYDGEPPADVGPGRAWPVVVTTPDGAELSSDDPAVHDALSAVAGRPVRLVPLPAATDRRTHRAGRQGVGTVQRDLGLGPGDRLPGTTPFPPAALLSLARFTTPPGAFHDLYPVHLLSTRTLATMAALEPAASFDVRRFRPTVVLEVDDDVAGELPEHGWPGGRLALGGARLDVVTRTVRCVVPTRPQPGLGTEPAVMRTVARRADRFLGVYAEVAVAGPVAVGDPVTWAAASPPSAARRALDRGLGLALQQGLRAGSALTARRR